MKMNPEGKKWELISSVLVFTSKWIAIQKRSYRLPSGEIRENYYHLNRPDYVLVFAEDDKGRILLERQYRRGINDFVYELPAGWINENEKPIDAAKRELQEETGSLGDGDTSFEIYPQPGFSSMKAHVVVLKVHFQGGHSQVADEHIIYEWVEKSRLREMIKSGKIKDMGLLSALSVYQIKVVKKDFHNTVYMAL